MQHKINCWEFKKCNRDKPGGCPAYPKGGRICYLVAGTMCGGRVQGIYAAKIGQCRECDFYRAVVVEKTI